MTAVVDASALLRLLVDDSGADWMAAWCEAHKGERLVAPDLLYYETGQALRRYADRPGIDAAAHADLLEGIVLEPPVFGAEWQIREGLTFYDAAYVALAVRAGRLVTADRGMAARARKLGVTVDLCPA